MACIGVCGSDVAANQQIAGIVMALLMLSGQQVLQFSTGLVFVLLLQLFDKHCQQRALC